MYPPSYVRELDPRLFQSDLNFANYLEKWNLWYVHEKKITLNQKSSLASRFHHCRRLVERGSSLLRCFKLIPIFIIVGTFKSSSWGGLSHLPSNEFITCFHESCIYEFFFTKFYVSFFRGLQKCLIGIFDLHRKLLPCRKTEQRKIRRFRNRENMWWAWPWCFEDILILITIWILVSRWFRRFEHIWIFITTWTSFIQSYTSQVL